MCCAQLDARETYQEIAELRGASGAAAAVTAVIAAVAVAVATVTAVFSVLADRPVKADRAVYHVQMQQAAGNGGAEKRKD